MLIDGLDGLVLNARLLTTDAGDDDWRGSGEGRGRKLGGDAAGD